MMKSKRVLAVIPARGGSKGLPGKNIMNLHGKPLLAWTIEEAQKSKYIDRIILSSDDEEIIRVAREWGCEVPFVRPMELAQDHTPGIDPILHAIQFCAGYDYVVLLQPTSPLRTVEDIDGCISFCLDNQASACVSVTAVDKSPYWMYTLNSSYQLSPLIQTDNLIARRQDLPEIWALNGAVYVSNTTWLVQSKTFLTEDTLGFVMPMERSMDIDSKMDFDLAEFLLSRRSKS
jgi:CMP-N,N'-diacetyllegionaminic acid synthase